jgi:integrase
MSISRSTRTKSSSDPRCSARCATSSAEVYVPYALESKYPNAGKEWGWQYLFPAGNTAVDPRSGKTRRHHLGESSVQRAVGKSIGAARIHKHGSRRTVRHIFATHIPDGDSEIHTAQELLGHSYVRTTMTYIHVMNKGPLGVRSPLSRLTGF